MRSVQFDDDVDDDVDEDDDDDIEYTQIFLKYFLLNSYICIQGDKYLHTSNEKNKT